MNASLEPMLSGLAEKLPSGDPIAALVDRPDNEQLKVHAKQAELGKWKAGEAHRPLLAALLVRRALAKTGQTGSVLKAINAAAKAIDLANQPELSDLTRPGGLLDHRMRSLAIDETAVEKSHSPEANASGTRPLSVLFHEGPIARAYLVALQTQGIRPARIVNLVSSMDLATRKPVGGWVPGRWRSGYRQWHQRQQIHHWGRLIAKRQPDLAGACSGAVAQLGFDEDVQAEAQALVPLESYADDIQHVTIASLRDDALEAFLKGLAPANLLFTGGGIVPRRLLEIPDIGLMHVHPGMLPDLRGADCSLWSSLITGRLSASAFWMAPGIDEGKLIETAWLPRIDFSLAEGRYDLKTIYRAFYAFVDPWVRARLLCETLHRHPALAAVEGRQQDLSLGETYYFMHPLMQRFAFERMGLIQSAVEG